jgi:hypothetical protein
MPAAPERSRALRRPAYENLQGRKPRFGHVGRAASGRTLSYRDLTAGRAALRGRMREGRRTAALRLGARRQASWSVKNFSRGGGSMRSPDLLRAASRRLGAPEPCIPRDLQSRSARSNGAGSNAQCKQHNNTDPDNQRRKRNGIIIEPVPALYTHDATPIPK